MNNIETIDNPQKLVSDVLYHLGSHYPDEYDDLIGAGMLGLVKADRTYKPTKSKFITYAYIRIKGEIIDYQRKTDGYCRRLNKQMFTLVDLEPFENRLLTEPNLILVELKEALNKLSELELQILDLYYMGGLSIREISKKINISAEIAYMLYDSAIEKLKQEML
jgi:RNA polymerase sigma factor for flagellar operon FliA